MTKVAGYTPSWLSRPSPGFAFFNDDSPAGLSASPASNGASNTSTESISAVRGSEIFQVVGNELRWADLARLKERWESQQAETGPSHDESHDSSDLPPQAYRVLKTPGSLRIKRLVISPDDSYMAIVTSHTIHIAVLPDPLHLSSTDTAPLKLRSFQLGPTTHVVECAPVAAVLWHPWSGKNTCLVTVAEDAVVRVWELNQDDRGSFESPQLAVDLRKLANANSTADDCSPSRYGTRKGFSPDQFEMEVASACFGPIMQGDTAGWSSMTLWIAMKEGDIYVLCPLLPSVWDARRSTIMSLVNLAQLDHALLLQADDVSKDESQRAEQRMAWVAELEKQLNAGDPQDSIYAFQTFRRPAFPSSSPKLQGPFRLSPDPDQLFDIADIYALTAGSSSSSSSDDDQDDFSQDEPPVEEAENAQQLVIVCLATCDGTVHVCVSLSDIQPRWLPAKKATSAHELDSNSEDLKLLILDSLPVSGSEQGMIFTGDLTSPSLAFITHAEGVAQLDVAPLISKLQDEVESGVDQGLDFRVETIMENNRFVLEDLIAFTDISLPTTNVNACCNVYDVDLGHLVLATHGSQPHTVTLEQADPSIEKLLLEDAPGTDVLTEERVAQLFSEAEASRPPYQPPAAFWTPSSLPEVFENYALKRPDQSLSQEIRMSPATLTFLMDVHRLLSQETHRLGVAASDLFARCERLQDEFHAQISRVQEIADRVDSISGLDNLDEDPSNEGGEEDEFSEYPSGVKAQVERRVEAIHTRQETLHARYEEVQRKILKLQSRRPISSEERVWAAEVEKFAKMMGVTADEHAVAAMGEGDYSSDEGGHGDDDDGSDVDNDEGGGIDSSDDDNSSFEQIDAVDDGKENVGFRKHPNPATRRNATSPSKSRHSASSTATTTAAATSSPLKRLDRAKKIYDQLIPQAEALAQRVQASYHQTPTKRQDDLDSSFSPSTLYKPGADQGVTSSFSTMTSSMSNMDISSPSTPSPSPSKGRPRKTLTGVGIGFGDAGGGGVALERRRAKELEIETLLERQTALLQGTMEKVEQLRAEMASLSFSPE